MSNASAPARFGWVALAASVSTFLLIILGGFVRVTGSGLGCPDWPLCHGQIIPPFDAPTLIEYSHRLFSLLTTSFILGTTIWAWLRYRREVWIFRPAVAATFLLFVQIVLGGLTVLLELPPVIAAAHLTNALVILALLLVVTANAFHSSSSQTSPRGSAVHHRWLVWASTAVTLVVIISGALVTRTFAHLQCATWPLCHDQIFPINHLAQIAMTHRFITAGLGGLIAFTFFQVWQDYRNYDRISKTVYLAIVIFVAQIAASAMMVWSHFDLFWRLAHLTGSTAVWSVMVVVLIFVHQIAPKR